MLFPSPCLLLDDQGYMRKVPGMEIRALKYLSGDGKSFVHKTWFGKGSAGSFLCDGGQTQQFSPPEASDILGAISKGLKRLERKLLGGELLARIVFAGKKGFRMGFPPGQRGSAEHAEPLVSVPWKPEQEKIGLKAGRMMSIRAKFK